METLEITDGHPTALQPTAFCAYLLNAIEASEGRRRRRRRDTTPDAIGLQAKRDLLQRASEEKPAPEDFEGWLLQQVISAPASGPIRAICTEIFAEYQIASYDSAFVTWLAGGAASEDTRQPGQQRRRS